MRALAAAFGGLGVLGLAMVAGLTPAGAGAGTASPDAGAELSARWCAGCHVVSTSGAGGDAAPAFPAIADQRSVQDVRDTLSKPHATPMRGFNLSPREIEDLAAYVDSLRAK